MSDSLVIIPTYNEIENIADIVNAVLSMSKAFDLLVVDDGSPDGTAEKVREMQKTCPDRLFLLERKGKQGLGTAYLDGFRWGLQYLKYEYFFEMDADFSHPPKDLIRLYDACAQNKADVSIGSRYVPQGNVINWPRERVLLSYGASLYVRAMTWMPIKDPTAGFVCYKRKVLETIDLDKIRFIGYAFQIEMKFAAYQLNFKLVEVPIEFTDRMAGSSKMHKNIIKEAVFGVLQMRWHSFFESYKKNATFAQ